MRALEPSPRPPSSSLSAQRFHSPAPIVKLVNAFATPFDNAVATARTCYSGKGLVSAADVAARPEQRDRIARSTYQAGHHTILQHAHFQFSLENVSRQFLWSFLHAHPFYNSEQVSQRYVEVREDAFAVPPLEGEARAVYERTALDQIAAYKRLIEVLTPPAAREYYRIFPARRKDPAAEKDVKKKAQEIARYVLPVATFAYLYHTVSGLTLLRYHRLCEQYDAPTETRAVVGEMVRALLAHDPAFAAILEEPVPLEETPEHRFFAARPELTDRGETALSRGFIEEFDRELAGRTSKLVSRKPENEALVAQAVREVLGLPRAALADEAAIAMALSPSENRWLGETLTVTTLSKLSRALHHAHYTFKKKLSHTADSQDQRHRMTPGSRPILAAHATGEPDFIRPALVERSAAARDLFDESMRKAWLGVERLRELGVPFEHAAYLLPNATAIRFTESSELIHLHHKLKSRLCYLSQEEIWRASVDEARQIRDAEPTIGPLLLPPCGMRKLTATRPLCPEGDRYCGVPVWKLSIDEYARVI